MNELSELPLLTEAQLRTRPTPWRLPSFSAVRGSKSLYAVGHRSAVQRRERILKQAWGRGSRTLEDDDSRGWRQAL
jgi:hypothetical protein